MRTETELRKALAELADTAPDAATAADQIQLRGSTATSTRQGWGRTRVLLAACLAVVLIGVSTAVLVSLTSQRDAAGPTLEDRYRESLTIEPSTARPGDWLTLYFADESTRGIDFTLDAWTGSKWELTYYVFSDVLPPAGQWWTKEGPPAIPALGVGGPGGERVIVPPIATPGVYRLCTTNDDNPSVAGSRAPARKACGLVTVD